MEDRFTTSGLGQRAMELELKNVSEEIARVRDIARHMIFGSGIEEIFASRTYRSDALILEPKILPRFVVVFGFDLS